MKIVNFGSLNIDYTFVVSEIAKPGQTVSSVAELCFPGGKGLNQSVAIARAGHLVHHAGIIGEDGLFLKRLLENTGVDCRFIKVVGEGTGKAFIQVESSGQNCIVLSGGANQKNSHEYCDEVLNNFEKGDYLLVQNEVNCMDYLIDKAYEKGMIIVLNPSPMDEKVLACDLSKVSVFIMNEDEGEKITGESETEEILDRMAERYPGAKIILTLGKQGAVYSWKSERIFQESFQVETVDTTGAGDTFTGYLLSNMMEGLPMTECLKYAAKAASIAVTREGAASGIPCKEEVIIDG